MRERLSVCAARHVRYAHIRAYFRSFIQGYCDSNNSNTNCFPDHSYTNFSNRVSHHSIANLNPYHSSAIRVPDLCNSYKESYCGPTRAWCIGHILCWR